MSQPTVPAAGQQLTDAAGQVRLSGFTKTWTHLLAATAALALAVLTDGRITPLETLQVLAVLATALITWAVPGTLAKTLATLVGAAAAALGPYFAIGWDQLSSANISLMLVALLGALSSVLLPNVEAAPVVLTAQPTLGFTPGPDPLEAAWLERAVASAPPAPAEHDDDRDGRHAQAQAVAAEPPSAPVTGATRPVAVEREPVEERTEQAPAVPPVPAAAVSAMSRLRRAVPFATGQHPQASPAPQQGEPTSAPAGPAAAWSWSPTGVTASSGTTATGTTGTAAGPRRTPGASIRSTYTPPGSGATGVLPTQPPSETDSEDRQGPPPRGYDFGSR